ncbi:MAG TPA: hypothetical protein VMG38_15985 [Trebonia sp.]|nr:hypothetical protein [Trebonia sp.]
MKRYLPRRLGIAVAGGLAALVVFLPASGASAATTTLNGDWAPFNRCPVENSSMLAADGSSTLAFCLASDSPSGSITLGNITVASGDVNLQAGVLENTSDDSFTVVSPSGGALVAAPVQIPGGLLGLICPSDIPVVSAVCSQITSSALNTVTAVVQPAGSPSGFSLAAGLSEGVPIITVPVKIQLVNPLLGSDCYIGSNASPILLTPENLTAPKIGAEFFDANGTPDTAGVMESIASTGGTEGAGSAPIPGATGCGLLGVLDGVVDLKVGLPSPAGQSSFTLNDASSYFAGVRSPGSDDGQLLAQYWSSAQ